MLKLMNSGTADQAAHEKNYQITSPNCSHARDLQISNRAIDTAADTAVGTRTLVQRLLRYVGQIERRKRRHREQRHNESTAVCRGVMILRAWRPL